jgi:hypothetical protein
MKTINEIKDKYDQINDRNIKRSFNSLYYMAGYLACLKWVLNIK